jgi:enamine deaminase RidA (YjgF/YER057c/UK114 family)
LPSSVSKTWKSLYPHRQLRWARRWKPCRPGIEDGRQAARLATLNALALAKAHLQSLNRIKQIVRLGVSMVTTAEFQEHPKVADAASELLAGVFGPDKVPTRLVLGMGSLPLGLCLEVEIIFEVEPSDSR